MPTTNNPVYPEHLRTLYIDMLVAMRSMREMLKDGTLPCPMFGICTNLGIVIRCTRKGDGLLISIIRDKLFSTWPKFSGDICYPVPSDMDYDCKSTYIRAINKWVGKYGDLRRELLDHCISELEKLCA